MEALLIVTCDVKDMYNSIKIDLGLKAVRYWLETFPELLHPRFTTEFVLEALELVLKNSSFQFNDKNFTLISGTVTGTKVSPIYANLVMGYLEIKFYKLVEIEFGKKVHDYVFRNWKRFLDDCQIMWPKSFGDINRLFSILSSLDTDIKFTHSTSDRELPFLNVMLYIDKGKVMTDIYYKETDSHDYLPFHSCHPRHTKVNIPYTLTRMICTIVEDRERKTNLSRGVI